MSRVDGAGAEGHATETGVAKSGISHQLEHIRALRHGGNALG
jgi:hypothetical protein